MNGNQTGKGFDQRPQPSPESKSQGWAKKKFRRDLIKEFLNTKFTFSKKSLIAKELKEAFGDDVIECDSGTIATLRQIQIVINKGNPIAFEKLMNQAYGQPKQEIDVTSDGKPIKQNVIKLANGDEISI